MFKRLFWLSLGAIAGSWASYRLNRRMRESIARVMPERVAAEVTSKVRSLGTDLREAAREGRLTMKAREESLRAEIADR